MFSVDFKNSSKKKCFFLIWDVEDAPPVGDWTIVLWRSFGESNLGSKVISLPKLVEDQADVLKSRYLAWVYELGETHFHDKQLIDFLELRPGFSYWWMTLLAEKCNWAKSLQIKDVIQLFVLEEKIQSAGCTNIEIISGNKQLVTTIKHYCLRKGIHLKWKPSKQSSGHMPIMRRVYHSSPYILQAFVYLVRYIWQRWPLRNKRKNFYGSFEAEITFIDYLIYLDRGALRMGRFSSNYWTGLIEVFARAKVKINWLHQYVQHEAVSTAKQARDFIVRFNHNGTPLESHISLEGVLSFSLVFAVLCDYTRLVWRSLRLQKMSRHFHSSGSHLNFWPLFRQDWLESMRGSTAIWNCFALNLFEKTLQHLPRQKLGVYLQENQGWEMAFVHTWKASGHGRLIGVPHSTVRYWDLRYFFDSRSYHHRGTNGLPMPDQVGVNGPESMKAYRKGGYPSDQLIEVEALRYLYLSDFSNSEKIIGQQDKLLQVLVMGDYVPEKNKHQLRLLMEAATYMPVTTQYIIKPHPACPINKNDYPLGNSHITDVPLSQLLKACDIVYTSNLTSSAVDAYIAGRPVVSVLDGASLNMSPLRGLEGVVYVTNLKELVEALSNVWRQKRAAGNPYFCLDKGLSRWRKFLGLSGADTSDTIER